MATNNMVDKLGEAPIGSIGRYDFTAPANTGWLNCNGSAVSKITYAPLYALQGNAHEGTTELTEVDQIAGESGKSVYCVRWHPSSNYVAYISDISTKQLCVASFDGTDLTEVETIDMGSYGYSCDWHPDGDFLAAVILVSKVLKVYSWNGSDTLAEVESVATDGFAYSVAWHPNGNYLALSQSTVANKEVAIYSWDGSDTLTYVTGIDVEIGGGGLSWSNDGTYLAYGEGGDSSASKKAKLRIASWNGSDTLTNICYYEPGAAVTGSTVGSLSWSESGEFIVIGNNNLANKEVVLLSFDGSALTERTVLDYGGSGYIGRAVFSRGNNYIFTCRYGGTSTEDAVYVYSFNSSTYALTEEDKLTEVLSGSFWIDVNYTNNYIAWTGTAPTDSPYNKVYAGTTDLTSCDYRTNFLLPTVTTSVIRSF